MYKIFEKPSAIIVILALLSAYLFFYQSGRMALTDPDETFYAQSAKEMLSADEWVTPYLYGTPQFEKPIFIYWLVELSYKAFGVNEFAARFPSAIFAVMGVIGIFFLGSLLFNRRVGVLSGLMLATCVEYVILARACVTDMMLATFMLYGALFFMSGYLKEKKYFYVLSAASLGFAVLTKGPVALLLPGAAFIIFLLIVKDARAIKKIPIFSCVIAFLIVSAPWYLLAYKHHGMDFIDAFFGFHNVTRFVQAEHKIGSEFYYNIPIVFGGFFPWSVFLPYGFWNLFRRARPNTQYPIPNTQYSKKGGTFILTWFFVIFVFFSISSTKLPTYIFPCFISLALISAVFWDDFLKNVTGRAIKKAMDISNILLFTVIVIGSIGAAIYVKIDYPLALTGVIVSIILLIFGFLLSAVSYFRKMYVAALFFIIYALVIFLYPMSRLVIPHIEDHETSKTIAEELAGLVGKGEEIGCQSNYQAGLAFYTGNFPADLDRHENMVNFMNSRDRVWAVISDKNHRQLYDPEINPEFVKPSYVVYKMGKKVIVTNAEPENGAYIIRRERKR